jgi:hypothetical protein
MAAAASILWPGQNRSMVLQDRGGTAHSSRGYRLRRSAITGAPGTRYLSPALCLKNPLRSVECSLVAALVQALRAFRMAAGAYQSRVKHQSSWTLVKLEACKLYSGLTLFPRHRGGMKNSDHAWYIKAPCASRLVIFAFAILTRLQCKEYRSSMDARRGGAGFCAYDCILTAGCATARRFRLLSGGFRAVGSGRGVSP